MKTVFVWIPLFLIFWMRIYLAQGQHDEFMNRASCSNKDYVMAASVNLLAFDLAKQIGESGNMFFSPLGIAMSLGMAYLGARGNTSMQMEHALGYRDLNVNGVQVHNNIRELCEEIVKSPRRNEYTIMVANALFSQINLNIMTNFTQGLKSFYHADIQSVDFKNTQDAMGRINKWAREKTLGKVNQILNEPLPLATNIIMTNAIYFKGTWKIQFPVHRTYDSYFYMVGKEPKVVPMMMLSKESFRYLEDTETGHKYMDLPYKGDRVSMLFALPLNYDKSADLQMNDDLFCRLKAQMLRTQLDVVAIPRFRLEYQRSMKKDLVKMGMSDAFSAGLADFSGILSNGGVFISDVLHKAVIEVNEEGSEAAAVAGVIFRPVSFRIVPEFIANHPFLFYIVDHGTGTILFSGKVNNP